MLPIKRNIERIQELEKEIIKHDQVEIKVSHYFAPGTYAREMYLPKGVMLTGKIHKHAHLNIMSQGEITLSDENGPRRIVAPYTFISAPGTKRAFFAHEDTVWTTIHATEETDLDKIEKEMIAEDLEALCLG